MEKYQVVWIVIGIIAISIIITIAILIAAFGYLRHVSISIDDASLTRFAVVTSPATVLAYNLSLTLSVHNPNCAIGIKYTEPFEAAYSFDGQQFERVQVADSGEKHPARKTRVYHLVTSSGGENVALGNAGIAAYKKANAIGEFEVEVALTAKMSYTGRYHKCKLEATCPLKLLLAPSTGTTVLAFEKVKCKLADPENKYC